jgi:hypothetical protein
VLVELLLLPPPPLPPQHNTMLMVEAGTVSEMLDQNAILTSLFIHEDFIAFSYEKSVRSYRG